MVTKKTLNFVILSFMALFVIMASGFSADVYVPYKTVFSTSEVPTDVYVSGYACTSAACTDVDNSAPIELYSGNAATTCWADYNAELISANEFFTCMENSKLNSNYQNISIDGDYVVVKYDSTKSFGYLTYFSANSDSYFVKYDRINDINCEFDTCFDNNYRNLEFVKGVNAIAEIGNINIVNTDNKNKPVQVTVPVEISETVCSAYQFSNPNWWRATIPNGYSDYSAETDIKLTIKDDNSNEQYFSKRITTSILADNCASLTAFEWTPDVSLENARVEFKVETDVVDNQVVSSRKDFAFAYETIYPADLDSTCYARIEDFMLSNEASFDLNSEITQIQVGENLFANFKAGAYRDESVTPMNFDFDIYFDDSIVSGQTNLVTTNSNLLEFNEDLTSSISSLGAGTHSVKVVVNPNGLNCDISNDVTQIQNLIITEPETYDVSFRVLGDAGIELSGALVNFDSMELFTAENGEVKFSSIDKGEYNYIISYDGYQSKSGSINVASDIMVTITLSSENSAPVVDFPAEFVDYYTNNIETKISDYIVDYNEDFTNLNVLITRVSGDSTMSYNSISEILTLTSSGKPEESDFLVTVTDSAGAESSDTFKVIFNDNSAPVITSFTADDYDGYKVFSTNFNIEATDLEGSELLCSINFADGSITDFIKCTELDGLPHSFSETGDYNVVLTVKDAFGNEVTADLDIYVYEEVFRPYVESFDLTSSNGNIVPSDLVLSWVAYHENVNEDVTCELFVNDESYSVACDGSISISDFDIVGDSIFKIVVSDSNGNSDNKIIESNFENEIIDENFKPFITSFDLSSSNGNFVPTDLSFVYVVGHEDVNEEITCSIKINSNDNSVPCSLTTFDLDNYANEGLGTFTLTVVDSDGDNVSSVITREFQKEGVGENFKPFITSFDLVSSNGNFVPTNLTFDYSVGHENDEDIECSILVNGISNDVDCGSDFDVTDFNIVGDSTFKLVVSEVSGDDSVEAIILRTFEEEIVEDIYKPFITSFDLVSSNGNFAPSDIDFSYVVGHENGEEISCSILVNGISNDVGCSSTFDLNNYNVVGNSVFKLVVSEVNGLDTVEAIILRTFEEEPEVIDYKPFITSFDINLSNGNVVPTDVHFDWGVGHENNESLVCELIINGNSQVVDCNDSFDIVGYNTVGQSTFELVVSESVGLDVVSSLIIESFEEVVIELNELGINLLSDEVLELYEFDFSIEIENESMARRMVALRPELICGGSRAVSSNPLKREMAEGIYSNTNNNYVFDFELDTRDFNLHINPGYCELKVVLIDDFESYASVSKLVKFKFADKVQEITSIRGNGLDVMNYMQTAILGNVVKGYNDVEFNVYNRESFAKGLSVTVISPKLNIDFSDSVHLAAGEFSRVQVPLFVGTDVAPGMYPVRYSINYGTEKYSRYSYIQIK